MVKKLWKIVSAQFHGVFGTQDAEAAYLDEIMRLAETAPHLLEDIGFRPVFPAPPGVLTMWRRGAVTVGQTIEGDILRFSPDAPCSEPKTANTTLRVVNGGAPVS